MIEDIDWAGLTGYQTAGSIRMLFEIMLSGPSRPVPELSAAAFGDGIDHHWENIPAYPFEKNTETWYIYPQYR